LIAHLGNEKSIHYYNMLTEFSDEAGNLNEHYYSSDGIHLKADGYYIWGKHIKEQMEIFK
jgi:lysophospholipase L1-like esterase